MQHPVRTAMTLAFLGIIAFAQTSNPQLSPDSWRGMAIDESGPDDALKLFGKPDEDKVDRIKVQCYDTKLLVDKQAERVFRLLLYKHIPGFSRVQFAFLEDKLVLVTLFHKDRPEAGTLHALNLWRDVDCLDQKGHEGNELHRFSAEASAIELQSHSAER